MKYPKEATYSFYVNKDGKEVNMDTLTEDERKAVGIWAYQTILESMGYVRIEDK